MTKKKKPEPLGYCAKQGTTLGQFRFDLPSAELDRFRMGFPSAVVIISGVAVGSNQSYLDPRKAAK